MESRIWNRTLLLAVSAAAFANLSVGLSPSRGAETPPDPRLLLEKSADRLVESVLDTAGHYRLARRAWSRGSAPFRKRSANVSPSMCSITRKSTPSWWSNSYSVQM